LADALGAITEWSVSLQRIGAARWSPDAAADGANRRVVVTEPCRQPARHDKHNTPFITS
jgi:hypothetical protein